MGLFGNLFGGAAGNAVSGAVSAAADLTHEIGTAIRGSEPVDQNKLAELESSLLTAQAEINKAEAQSSNAFIAGWRPFIGWICGLGIAMEFLVRPIVSWFVDKPLPVLDVGQLIALVIAMLGVAGYRTIEKANGTVGSH